MLTIDTGGEWFEFRLGEDGEVQRLPLAGKLPLTMLQRLADMARLTDPAERNMAAVELELALLRRYCPDIADEVTMEQANMIVSAWNRASGIELGE